MTLGPDREHLLNSPRSFNTIETPFNTIETPLNTIETPFNTIETPFNTIETPFNTFETPESTSAPAEVRLISRAARWHFTYMRTSCLCSACFEEYEACIQQPVVVGRA